MWKILANGKDPGALVRRFHGYIWMIWVNRDKYSSEISASWYLIFYQAPWINATQYQLLQLRSLLAAHLASGAGQRVLASIWAMETLKFKDPVKFDVLAFWQHYDVYINVCSESVSKSHWVSKGIWFEAGAQRISKALRPFVEKFLEQIRTDQAGWFI